MYEYMRPDEFQLAVPVSEWPQNYAFNRTAPGVGYRQVTTLISPLCADVWNRCIETEKIAVVHTTDFRDARLMQHHVMLVTVILRSICTYLQSTATFGSTDYPNEYLWLQACIVAGSIPDGGTGIFHWHNPSGRTMSLWSTQPSTEMSTRNNAWG
jgi:hypothetical protein